MTQASPSNWQEIQAQLGESYAQFDEMARRKHVALLQRVEHTRDAVVAAEPVDARRWVVTVATADYVGVLSVIAGLFAGHRIQVLSGDVFSLRFDVEQSDPPGGKHWLRHAFRKRRPKRLPATRKILDVFEVETRDPVDLSFWESFREELVTFVTLLAEQNSEAVRARIMDRVSEAFRAPGQSREHLFPIAVEIDNASSPEATKLSIRSTDTLGFLFEFVNALAVLNVNIERVEIRTRAGEVQDTFWVTDTQGKQITRDDRLHELRVVTVLIQHFTHLLPRAPNPGQALRQFSALTGQMLSQANWVDGLQSLESGAVLRTLADMMGVSQFLWEDFLRMQHENLFPIVHDAPALDDAKSERQLRREYAAHEQQVHDYEGQKRLLNEFKDREMFRIDLRHITGRIGFEGFSRELSALAELIVSRTAEMAHQQVAARLGTPLRNDGSACAWSICALGKFGGGELGFASDIELLFVYETEGSTEGPEPVNNARYFEEFARTFLKTLVAHREGIFQIDLRLRPYGNAGNLACSCDTFAKYFSQDGAARQFERMALVKMRAVAGSNGLARRISEARDRFVFSGVPLDLDNLRHLRQRQATELVLPGTVSAKHSAGGLVDVEYFVQALQIVAGHSTPHVRVTNTLTALDQLAQTEHLSAELAGELRETYAFLRRLIDGLRVVRGHAKDLTIPPRDSTPFDYLARRLKYESPAELDEEIRKRMTFAQNLWEQFPTA